MFVSFHWYFHWYFVPILDTLFPLLITRYISFAVQLQIEEISRRLRTGDLGIPQNPEERSELILSFLVAVFMIDLMNRSFLFSSLINANDLK